MIPYIINDIIHGIGTVVIIVSVLIKITLEPTVSVIIPGLLDILPPDEHKIILEEYPRQTDILLVPFAVDGQVECRCYFIFYFLLTRRIIRI